MVTEGHILRGTMPSNPRLDGTTEIDELCRYLRSLVVLENIDELLEERFDDIPPEFEPALLSCMRNQSNSIDSDDEDESLGLSGVPVSAVNGDPARISRRRRVDEERHHALEAAELELRESGDLSQTPREYLINGRTIDWVRSFYESPPEDPEQYDVTQSTTSPVPLGLLHGYDPEEYENESPPQVQYMVHNRRWGLRDVDVIPTIEEETSADIQIAEDGKIKEESDQMESDQMDWKADLSNESVDDADRESNGDAEVPPDMRITRSGRTYHTREAPSPDSRQPGRARRRPEAARAATSKGNQRNKRKTAKGSEQAPKTRKRQRSNSDDDGRSEDQQGSSKRQRPLRRSSRLAEAGKASSV
ncbi:hypothetical protein DTO212C5_5092 [Paecilomyces variotii]|nr:hypothetical protein DTO212C5_5092 [Paecilomyces variotii]